MTFPRRIELLLASVLAVSLAAKGAINVEASPADQAHLAQRLEALFEPAGLRVYRPQPFAGTISIRAQRGSCNAWAVEYSPHGTAADIITAEAGKIGPLRFAYHGQLFNQPPRIRALLSFYLWREARRLGFPAKRRPVIAVAASSSCDLERLDWQQVAQLGR